MGDARSDILIVDDDEDTCAAFGDVLADCGYEVEFALNGDAALELARNKAYRVVLVDFRMPGMTGVDLFRRLLDLRRGIAGILITAFLSSDAQAAAQSVGIQQILSKPVDMLELINRIQELLSRM